VSHQKYGSAVRSATLVGDDNTAVPDARSITAILDVTAVPGVDTVQLIIEGKDPLSGKYYTVLQGATRVATGTDVLTVAPGITVTANVSAAAVVPSVYRVRVIHSAASNFTYSVSVREA
jgi:hypothetical protein